MMASPSPSKDYIGGKAAGEIFKIFTCACVPQFMRWKENLATALKLRSWTYARYSDGHLYSSLWMLTKHQHRIENAFFAKNTNVGLALISASLTVLIIGGNCFEREIVKMTIKCSWCTETGLFGFYFHRKWCLIDWN